jgi:nucleotidyltransferase substrate binding protein (TIGR01987 family)
MNNFRWEQRFTNFEKAFIFFENAALLPELSVLEQAGLVKAYEIAFELSWKTLKDFLASKDITVQYPRDIIKESFQFGIIADGETWIEMLDNRNLLVHTYDGDSSKVIITNIRTKYYGALKQLYKYLKELAL